MLRIRLKRGGKRHQPYYRIVVAEHSAPVKGSYVYLLGNYDPRKKIVVLDKDETIKWLNNGAKPSNTVAKILKKEGIEHKSIVIKTFKSKSKQQIEAEKKEKEAQKTKEAAEKEKSKAELEAKNEQEAKEKKESDKEEKDEKSKESDTTDGRSGSESKDSNDKDNND